MNDITAASLVLSLRGRARLSQRALAARAHTSQAVVARIESGHSMPSLDTLKRLAAAGGFQLAVTLVAALASDPVVDAYKPGVDKTLLIEQLRKTPEQRLNDLISAERTVAEFRRAGREARERIAGATSKKRAEPGQR